jgi:hypothetical protein
MDTPTHAVTLASVLGANAGVIVDYDEHGDLIALERVASWRSQAKRSITWHDRRMIG